MKSKIVKTAMLMAILTLISKAFGFIREMVLAAFFGTSYIVDAYVMASTILSVLFGGVVIAVSTAYMPIFSMVSEIDGEKEGIKFTNKILNILLIISILISIFGILFSDEIIGILAKGFTGETASLASFYVKVIFIYIVFSSVASIFEAYLQYKEIFLPQIISGYFVSISIIVAIIISAYTSSYYLAFGMLVGYGLRCFSMGFIAKKNGFIYSWEKLQIDNNIKQLAKLAIPAFIGGYITYINLFVDKTLASNLQEGSIAALNYASLLISMIVGVSITILSTIVYPRITQANTLGQMERFSSLCKTGINLISIIAFPFSFGAILYAQPVIRLVYERGAFDSLATTMTQSAFQYYSAGLFFMAANEFISKIYYSVRNMKIPMYFGIVSVLVNIILSIAFVKTMGHNGLALATSIALAVNTLLLIIGLKIKYPEIAVCESKVKLLKIFIAAIFSVGISYIIYLKTILISESVVHLFISITIAMSLYIILLRIFKIKELMILKELLYRKTKD